MPKVVAQKVATKKPVARKTGGSVVDRIQDMEFDEDDGITVCLYGASGSGKTTFWATFPGPILSIICSGSSKPGELRSVNTAEYKKKIKTVTIEKSTDIKELVQHQKETGKYKTIVLDHATGLQDWVLKEILGLEELPAQLGWGIASQQTWGQVALQMKELLRAILELNCNRVIVAQEREFKASEENDLAIPYVGPALSPSVTGWLTPACDYVVNTCKQQKVEIQNVKMNGVNKKIEKKVKGVSYALRTGPDTTYMTKFRVPKGTPLPEFILDPTYEQVLEIIQGGA